MVDKQQSEAAVVQKLIDPIAHPLLPSSPRVYYSLSSPFYIQLATLMFPFLTLDDVVLHPPSRGSFIQFVFVLFLSFASFPPDSRLPFFSRFTY